MIRLLLEKWYLHSSEWAPSATARLMVWRASTDWARLCWWLRRLEASQRCSNVSAQLSVTSLKLLRKRNYHACQVNWEDDWLNHQLAADWLLQIDGILLPWPGLIRVALPSCDCGPAVMLRTRHAFVLAVEGQDYEPYPASPACGCKDGRGYAEE